MTTTESGRRSAAVLLAKQDVRTRARRVLHERTVEALRWARLGNGAIHGVLFLLPWRDARRHAQAIMLAASAESETAIQQAAAAQTEAFLRLLNGDQSDAGVAS